MTPQDALKIVEAVENTSTWYRSAQDHAEATVANMLDSLANNLADSLSVPRCSCHYGHSEDKYMGNEKCPRRGFAS